MSNNTNENQQQFDDLPEQEESHESHEMTDEELELLADEDENLSDEERQKYEEEIASLKEKALRAAAEAENVRKRASTDIEKARIFSIESFAKDIVGALDNLFRATDVIGEEEAQQNEKLKSLKEGIDISKREFVNVLERSKIKRIDPKGEKFDHNLHQAMSQIVNPDLEENTVVDVMQAGYTINGRILRPALVILSKKS